MKRTPDASFVVLTGAGISADSGLSTFRGAGGTWEDQRIEDVATPRAWHRDPARVWRFYQLRRQCLRQAQPNAAHHALAHLERELARRGGELVLVTQNVDALHERAGSRALEMHGRLWRLRCERCEHAIEDRENLDPEHFVPCPACGFERLRPDVVWFEELPHGLATIDAALRRCTHFAALGTSGVVWPAAGFLDLARNLGARTWVASLERPENLHSDDRFVPGRAIDVVPELVEQWLAEERSSASS